MAKILIVVGNVPAIVTANLELAHLLKQATHTVIIASSANIQKRVESRNQTFFKLKNNSFPTFPKRSFFGSSTCSQTMSEAVEKLEDDSFTQLLNETRPDLVLIDCEQHASIIKLCSLNISFALISNWFTYAKHPNLPPLHNVAIPGRGWRGSRLMIDLLWRKFWLTLRIRNAKEWLKSGGISRLGVYKAYAKKHGVSFSKIATPYMWLLPFTFKSLPIITSVPQELDLPHDKPKNFHYLGPIVDINRPEPAVNADELNELEKILNSPQIQSKEKHLIYASTSSIFEPDVPFFKKLIQALKGMPECELVLALGKKLNKEKLGELPSNVHAFNWVPQLRVLKQADVAITHAGINTVNECLHFKVPMLVYSGAHIDQNGTAARIGYHNLGIVGNKAADGPAEIKAHIKQLLQDKPIQAAVSEMSLAVRRYERDNRPVKVVEALLAKLKS